MTIYYVDPESGSDAGDGLSFATRWKTLKNLRLTAYAAGDEIRFKASKPPYSLGGAQWVDNQAYFTLDDTSAFVVVDDCATGWVMTSPNLVNYLNPATSYDNFMDAGMFLRIVPENFTGKLAHKTLPAVMDLSAFTHISLLMNNGQQWPLSMRMSLCSDTDGNVPIVNLAIEKFRSFKFPALLTNGGAALPNNVRSIAIHVMEADSHNFNQMVFDNIIACKAPTAPNHVSHGILVSRMTEGEPEWMPVRGFQAPGRVYIGGCRGQGDGTLDWPKWRGPAGSSEAFAMQPTRLRFWYRYENDLPVGGGEYDYSGGWNRTDMSTQDSVTWLHGEHSRMMSGGQGSANPDLPSAVDRQQQIFNLENSGGWNSYVWRRWTFKKFGLAEFYKMPFNFNEPAVSMDVELAGMVGVRSGFEEHGPYSHFNLGCVSFCFYGPFMDNNLNVSLVPDAFNARDHIGPCEYVAEKVVGSFFNYFPPTSIGVQNVYAIGRIENCFQGIVGRPGYRGRETGFFKLTNTSFRWCNYDIVTVYNMHLDNCKFLDDATGLPTRNPSITFNSRKLAQVRMDSVNGKSWDARTYIEGGQSSRVMEGVGRSPDKRTLVLEPQISQNTDTRLKPVLRERIALVVARAGIPTVVSAYLKQSAPIDGNPPYVLPQFVRIATVPGQVKGVGRHTATGIQRPNVWGRVVLEFTAEEDALVPIYLETNTYTAWGTECGLDDSGQPPDPFFPKPPPAMTDSFKFVAFYERILDALDSYEAGTQEAEDGMAAGIGVPFPGMTDGTILDMSPGNIIGAALIPESGTIQVYGILSPGYQNNGSFLASYVLVKNEAGDIIAQGEAAAANPTALPSMPGYAMYAYGAGVATELPVAGGTYTVEIWRGEPD